MARPPVIVYGRADVFVDSGASNALEKIGYCQDGVRIDYQPFKIPVPCDDMGGSEGPPTDVQLLGEIAHIQMEFTRWNLSIAKKVMARLKGQTYGQQFGTLNSIQYAPGALMIGSGLYFRLLIKTPTDPKNYPCVIFEEPHSLSLSTKFSSLLLTGTAYPVPQDSTGNDLTYRLLENADLTGWSNSL
jgi:hypothetical protein